MHQTPHHHHYAHTPCCCRRRSWGPLGWLVPSEIQTLETRPAGMSAAVTANVLFSFIIGEPSPARPSSCYRHRPYYHWCM